MFARNKGRRLLLVALLIGSVTLAVQASWMQAKAWLAQQLIAHAWERTLHDQDQHRPWSWADIWPVARLVTPSGDSLFVLDGISGQALAFGPGFLSQSSPAGQPGTMVLAGHQDSHFRFLAHANPGDRLRIQTGDGHWHDYRIAETAVVDSRHARLRPGTEEDELLLVTCYPFGSVTPGGPLRYLVRAAKAPLSI